MVVPLPPPNPVPPSLLSLHSRCWNLLALTMKATPFRLPTPSFLPHPHHLPPRPPLSPPHLATLDDDGPGVPRVGDEDFVAEEKRADASCSAGNVECAALYGNLGVHKVEGPLQGT